MLRIPYLVAVEASELAHLRFMTNETFLALTYARARDTAERRGAWTSQRQPAVSTARSVAVVGAIQRRDVRRPVIAAYLRELRSAALVFHHPGREGQGVHPTARLRQGCSVSPMLLRWWTEVVFVFLHMLWREMCGTRHRRERLIHISWVDEAWRALWQTWIGWQQPRSSSHNTRGYISAWANVSGHASSPAECTSRSCDRHLHARICSERRSLLQDVAYYVFSALASRYVEAMRSNIEIWCAPHGRRCMLDNRCGTRLAMSRRSVGFST